MSDAHDEREQRAELRAADVDRDAVAEQLHTAVAEGRLDLTELDDRLTATFGARTHAELAAVTADLPADSRTNVQPLTLQTQSGSLHKDGYWTVPSLIIAECRSGSIRIDFTAAVCPHREVTVRASVSSGSIVLIVPHGWAVDLDHATATSGSLVSKVRERPHHNAPVLRINGVVRSGMLKARYPRRSFWSWLLRRPR